MKYLKRFIGLPFFLCLNIIGMFFTLIKMGYYFMIYGGETIMYMHKNENKMIADIYTELINNKKNEK